MIQKCLGLFNLESGHQTVEEVLGELPDFPTGMKNALNMGTRY